MKFMNSINKPIINRHPAIQMFGIIRIMNIFKNHLSAGFRFIILSVSSLLLFAIPLSTNPIYSNPQIDHIKELYAKANKLQCSVGCEHNLHEIRLNTMLPAVGLQTTTIKMYYTSSRVKPEKDPHLLSRSLHKVVVEYNISAGAFYHMEYLYDDKEKPVFHFREQKTVADEKDTKRYYFSGSNLIQVIMDYHSPDGELIRYTSTDHFKSDVIRESRDILIKGENYRALFHTLIKAEGWK